ncbi:MAG: leucyl/phenylalanyl-tRNA--protein transferase [Pseudomonadota bacterium]
MPVYLLNEDLVFPKPSLAREDGLLAVGGDLSVERLLLAYRGGIFPWYTDTDPILWWSPDPRLVLDPKTFYMPRRLRRQCRRCGWQITLDRDFAQVISACAGIRDISGEGTWITAEMAAAYRRLHTLGYAHSVEVWDDGALIGGLYGVSVGKGFFGESMFSRCPNASKIALAALVQFLSRQGFHFIDCQVTTAHLMQFGAAEVPRAVFLRKLNQASRAPGLTGRWDWEVSAASLVSGQKG